ncbi:MAG TPA: HTH domain-containing protein, partial [Pseudomonadota bacterium]|nr:HTH domain-containing protein [Pseudomonadota bacterium]
PPRPSLITTPSPVMAPPPPLSATTPNGGAAPAAGPGGNRPETPPPPRLMTMADAAYDVLRGSSDGRPLAFRQIAEIALKRRLLRGEPADVARALRTALVREHRQRDSEGLRPRIRTVGPGQYMLSERKLEPELYNAERELLDRLNRTREATRVALRRRLRGLPAGAFELLMRLLLERLGMLGAELIKRGEGVAYYSGQSQRGARSQKVLVAVRPGEAELTREAVGELRAGVRLRGFDEGLLLCAGRASSAAITEASAVPALDIYDQDALTDLLIRNQLGVRRMHLPIDYLDAELLGELSEPS